MKTQKPNKFETMKTKVMKFDTAHLFMLSYNTIKFETFWLKVILFYFFPFENNGIQSKPRGTLK